MRTRRATELAHQLCYRALLYCAKHAARLYAQRFPKPLKSMLSAILGFVDDACDVCTAAAVAACCLAAAASRTAVSIRERVWVEKLATTARKSAGCRWASAVMDACTRVESSVCGPSARLRGRGSERITRGAAALSGCWGCWGYLGC